MLYCKLYFYRLYALLITSNKSKERTYEQSSNFKNLKLLYGF